MNNKSNYRVFNEEEASLLLQSANGTPIVMKFSADWKGTSQIMDNILKELSAEYPKNIHFVKIDTEDSEAFANEFGVHRIPTTLIFKDKTMIDHFEGMLPKQEVKEKIEKAMG
ncbi:MAG: thioredoxin family protein [Bacteroidota bacterium]